MSSAPTITYRVYCFDSARHILRVDELDAAGDEDAIAKAQAEGFGDTCEIWDEKRLVAQLAGERQTG
jgi:hypothetical protein